MFVVAVLGLAALATAGALVAVGVGEGIRRLLTSLGVQQVVAGGQSMNAGGSSASGGSSNAGGSTNAGGSMNVGGSMNRVAARFHVESESVRAQSAWAFDASRRCGSDVRGRDGGCQRARRHDHSDLEPRSHAHHLRPLRWMPSVDAGWFDLDADVDALDFTFG
jgi:hypothetical protein